DEEDYGTPDNNPMDVHTHGTHVAGILAARTNNGVGIASASYNVKTLAMRAGYAYRSDQYLFGDGLVDDFARATQYVANRGARVVSFSYGYDYPDSAWQAAVNYLAANDALVFGAAGNNDNASYIYPAMFENAIAVAALNRGNVRAWFSSYGSWVDIAAPGVAIWSTVMPNMINSAYYTQYSGTSMATPNVAAVAALLWSKNPALSAIDVRTAIYQTATNLTQINPGYMLGAGGVDARAAIETIPERPLRLLTPSSIEDTLWIGCPDTFRWVDQSSTTLRIQSQTNYPYGEWTTLFASTPNDGWEPWIPTGIASKMRFRILSNTDFRWQDRSDNDLPLSTKALVLNEPNSGVKLFNAIDTIRWAKRGVERIRIEWNRYYPLGEWELIASHVDASIGYMQWIIPRVGTNNARIKITDESDATRFDISNASFTIRSSQILITSFATKDTVYTGIPFTLRWSSFGVSGNLALDVNTSYPTGNWIRYDGSVPNYDSLRITLPHSIYGENTRLRLRSNNDSTISAIHFGSLRIVRPWIQITNPNGGENWSLFQSYQVRWQGDHIAPVRVQIARDYPSNQWNDVSDVIANTGSYWWGVIPPWSSRCRIRVFFRDFPSIGDTTDCDFSLSGVGISEQTGLLPDRFTVETPYPNPANREVLLRFAIPSDAQVTVEIFNLQGRQIERLSSQWYRSGFHSIRWNPGMQSHNAFTSGVYFVKVAYAGQTLWGKGVILR
ncbi:MAG: S8 family peptidase, partial [bacterium]|nr:S8 family peptidase [bacterium]